MSKDILYPLRRLHGQIYEWWLAQKRRFALWQYIIFPLGKKVFILGTPTHTNIGDSCIGGKAVFVFRWNYRK